MSYDHHVIRLDTMKAKRLWVMGDEAKGLDKATPSLNHYLEHVHSIMAGQS